MIWKLKIHGHKPCILEYSQMDIFSLNADIRFHTLPVSTAATSRFYSMSVEHLYERG